MCSEIYSVTDILHSLKNMNNSIGTPAMKFCIFMISFSALGYSVGCWCQYALFSKNTCNLYRTVTFNAKAENLPDNFSRLFINYP